MRLEPCDSATLLDPGFPRAGRGTDGRTYSRRPTSRSAAERRAAHRQRCGMAGRPHVGYRWICAKCGCACALAFQQAQPSLKGEIRRMGRGIHLEGKDWFTEAESAEYCGVALSTFREGYRTLGIAPRRFMGRKLYARTDLFAAIDRSPCWDPIQAPPLLRLPSATLDAYPNLRAVRLRPYKPRKKTDV